MVPMASSVLKQVKVIAAVINKSIYHPVVKEKLIKIIQYYTQFLLAYYQNASKAKLARLQKIQFIMSTCRYYHNHISIQIHMFHPDLTLRIIFFLLFCLHYLFRKSIRFGRCLNHAYTASQLIHKIRSSTDVDLHVYGELSEELFNVSQSITSIVSMI